MKTQNGGVDAKNRAVEDSCRFSSHEHDPDPQRSEKSDPDPYQEKSGFESTHFA
jgi:hypothetical protein